MPDKFHQLAGPVWKHNHQLTAFIAKVCSGNVVTLRDEGFTVQAKMQSSHAAVILELADKANLPARTSGGRKVEAGMATKIDFTVFCAKGIGFYWSVGGQDEWFHSFCILPYKVAFQNCSAESPQLVHSVFKSFDALRYCTVFFA